MSDNNTQTFCDRDRVSHPVKGLGTEKRQLPEQDLLVSLEKDARTGPDMVVAWDNGRFPIGEVSAAEIEALPPAAAAISMGVR